MNKKIFRSTCLVAFFVFLLSLVMIFGILFGHFESMLTKELKSEAEYIAKAVDQAGEDYLSAINSYDARITLISPDGTVLFDSVADPSSMGNHLGREEVQKALKYGAGESSASKPSSVDDLTGMPMTGRVVCAAKTPAKCAAFPAAAMITPKPFSFALCEKAAASSGVRCADMTCASTSMPKRLSSRIAGETTGRSLSLPMMTATFFAADIEKTLL